ncbi:MAG: hypothetical protein WC188_12685 [Candidatus Caldatribacteriota bacterium]
MKKSIYEEAVETLNKYRNQNYNSTNKDEVELANAINVVLPNCVKQEKLLELYRKLSVIRNDLLSYCEVVDDDYDDFEYIEIDLEQQIKEIENE